jgi:alpha-L-fucosidase 2
MAVWARLERGDKVAACLRAIVRNSLSSSLRNTGSNQIDCNFGYTAGVAEALLQSHAGEISLLPALPAGWTDGTVRGLRARGGFEVSVRWAGGRLQSAEIRNAHATGCRVRYGANTADFSLKAGETIRLNDGLATVD